MSTKKNRKTSTPAKAGTKGRKAKAVDQPAPAPPKKLSALAAAFLVLQETAVAMSCPQLIERMAAQGYWTSPGGKTPAATLHAALLREIKNQGPQA
jgi:hypothetical protein